MTYYLNQGTRYDVTSEKNITVTTELPIGTYTVGFDQFKNVYYLSLIDDLSHKGKIYGDTESRAKRILATFNDRPFSTGVLLSGEKGSGKTLLTRLISIIAREQGVPTIIINHPWSGEDFNKFVQSISQPTIMLFDEFEKVYEDDQNGILTLLDGTYQSKKLFLMTCNDKWRVNQYMLNRPGRFFYALQYDGIEESFIREYCGDNLKNKATLPEIIRISKLFEAFNFDMLKALVEELNRYGETVVEALKFLNLNPDTSRFRYKVNSFKPATGEEIEKLTEDVSYGERISITNGFHIEYNSKNKEEEDEEGGYRHVNFKFEDIIKYDANGKIVAQTDEGIVEIERVEEKQFSAYDLIL